MANRVLTINRKKYAVGLFWQPIGVGQRVRNYARTLARSIDKKLNLYTEYRAMTGLGARRAGLRPGMSAAAAEVMDSLTEYSSFLAVFEVGGMFYLVAVRNGIILQDKVLKNAAAAREEYVRLFAIPDWNVLIAPASWAMPRAIERNLNDVVTGRAHAVLRPISHSRAVIFSVILMCVFLVLGFSVFRGPIGEMLYMRPSVSKIDPELAAEYKRQIEEKNKQLDAEYNIQKQTPPPPLVMPYDQLPDVSARASVCFQAMGFLMQPVVGWNQTSVSCGEDYATVNFRRSFGTLGDFYSVAGELMAGATVDELSDDTLSVRVALPKVDMHASQDARDADSVARDVITLFQGMASDVDVQIASDTLTNGVDVAELHVVEVAATSKLVPMRFMEIFSDFGGVYMARCAWDVSRRTWNYEVIIYAK